MWTAGTTAAGTPCMRLQPGAVGTVCRKSCPLSAVRKVIIRLVMVALISKFSLNIKSAFLSDITFVTAVLSSVRSGRFLSLLSHLCELFDTCGGIRMLPGSQAGTPGSGPTASEGPCQHKPANK